jgi:Ca-activated chloride channel family protein
MGEPFVVTRPEDADDAAARFRTYVENPVLSGITVQFEGIDAYEIEPKAVPDLFAERPISVIGKWRGPQQGEIVVRGTGGEGFFEQRISFDSVVSAKENKPLRHLWARSRIAALSDFGDIPEDNSETKAQILELGLTYNLLTPYTSFVAVLEKIRNPDGNGTDVKQPLPLPEGVSNLAVSGGQSVPEPELWILVILSLVVVFFIRSARSRMART